MKVVLIKIVFILQFGEVVVLCMLVNQNLCVEEVYGCDVWVIYENKVGDEWLYVGGSVVVKCGEEIVVLVDLKVFGFVVLVVEVIDGYMLCKLWYVINGWCYMFVVFGWNEYVEMFVVVV